MTAPQECDAARRWLSAFRDAETSHDAAARSHIERCTACTAWEDRLDHVTRRLVLRRAESPDLTAPAMAAWRREASTEGLTQRRVARVLLTLAGVSGFALAVVSATGLLRIGETHVLRDLVAFECALSAGFLLAAWRPGEYSRGLLPVTAVAGVLTLFASSGVPRSDALAEAAHLPVLLGLLGLFVMFDALGLNRSAAPSGPNKVRSGRPRFPQLP